MANHGKTEKPTHPKASVTLKGRTVRRRRPSQGQSTSSKAAGSAARRSNAAKSDASRSSSRKAGSAQSSRARTSKSGASALAFDTSILSSKPFIIVAAIVAVLLVGLLWDTAANWEKAYGNVTVDGVDVGGMTADEIRSTLQESIGNRIAGTEVTVYASESARDGSADASAQAQRGSQTEQISTEEANQNVSSWKTNGTLLSATLPYDEIIEEAMAAGRKGGPIGRLAVMVAGENIDTHVVFGKPALEEFASTIDKTIGEERVDTTVKIENGVANPVEGHDGVMVDRDWLTGKLSDALLEKSEPSFVAEATQAPSRTTLEQAQRMSEGINKAIGQGVAFGFKGSSWMADSIELGNWTKVSVIPSGGGYELGASIDEGVATSSLVKNVSAQAKSKNSGEVTVDFEKTDDGIVVHTSGAGYIPEVVPAIDELELLLYGSNGIAWTEGGQSTPTIEIGESNAPESLTFDQAIELGIISVIGEYTTEFANDEGTENRNHNIKLVSELLNDSICEANGGTWSFNEHSGDTNQDPPFASAGSIVNGEYVDSIGGGICQVATTVFNAVFEAGLNVEKRQNHSLYISSYPEGRDVGVSYPELDFIWSNQLDSDVLLKLETTDTSVTARLYGVYTGYTVEAETSEWEEGDEYSTEIQEDSDLASGDIELKTVGENGRKISVTRTVKDKSGEVISEDVFDSVYEAKNEIYIVGPDTDTSGIAEAASESHSSSDESEEEESEDEETLDEETIDEEESSGDEEMEEESYSEDYEEV